ncbi:MAG: hypothetical protein ACQXXF_05865 [Thermoplasmatota archaeon]
METKLSTHLIQKTDFILAKDILKPSVTVLSGIKELDELLGGFKSGEITFIDGDSNLILNIPNQVCVNTYCMLRSSVVYIDGGICADPYRISNYARKMEVNQKEVLEHVLISRAFTVYQLTTLIQERLEKTINKYKPLTLIIGSFPILYLDFDVPSKEAKTLLRSNLHKIRELTTKYDLVTIFTNIEKKVLPNIRNVYSIIYKSVDEIVLMKKMELATCVELVNKGKNNMIFHTSNGQISLEDFGMVI